MEENDNYRPYTMSLFSNLDWPPIIKAILIFSFFEAFASGCTSACLLGISTSDGFSICFCILLFIFAIVFIFIALRSKEDRFMRILSIFGAVLMPIAALSCIFVNEDFIIKNSSATKAPLYIAVACSIYINFAINANLLINLCSFSNIKDRLLTNNYQIVIFYLLNFILGIILGIVFGLLRVEDRDAPVSKMVYVTVSFIFVGFFCGCGYGFFNEYETQKLQRTGLDPTILSSTPYDEM